MYQAGEAEFHYAVPYSDLRTGGISDSTGQTTISVAGMKAGLVSFAIKTFPVVEQVVLLAMFPA